MKRVWRSLDTNRCGPVLHCATCAAHKVRLALTVISVLLGTAFVAGSFVFTDTLKHSFDTIFNTSDKGIDARVQPTHDYDPGVPTNLVATIARAAGRAATVEPTISGAVVLVDSHGKKIQSNGAPSVGGMWSAEARSDPVPTFVSGHAPANGDRGRRSTTARPSKHHLHTGDHVKVVVPNAADRQRHGQRHLQGFLRHRRLRRRAVHPRPGDATVHRRQRTTRR